MPRQSFAAISLGSLTAPGHRLEPPPEMGGIERKIFLETVAAVDFGHFERADMPLLVAFCNAVAQEQRAAVELMISMVQDGAPSPWVAVHASAVRSMVALAEKLRLSPKARKANNQRARSRRNPSVYDMMDLGRDAATR
jgi:phage terminase small subunit